ncbi:hypothetical protein SAMN06296386_10949 [Lachnospiraceae bacterium]|nr:hypothetical protein SAMN06296386_10949 [Lachnospiraceae bacterium]
MKMGILKFAAVAFVTSLTLSLSGNVSVSAATIPSNIDAHNSVSSHVGDVASPTLSYLYVIDESHLMRVSSRGKDKGVTVYWYNNEYKTYGQKNVPKELPLFGGFHSDGTYYYLITGQENHGCDDETEVYRVTKYDKDWKRLGSVGLFGANTYEPFAAGSCDIVSMGDFLIVHTCHTMYSSDSTHHQANAVFEINTAAMNVTEMKTEVTNDYGYVSHSFNQYSVLNGDQLVSVDHGDAYPREIHMTRYMDDVTDGNFNNSTMLPATILSIPGATGDNNTGVTLGGLQNSDGTFLIAGTSAYKNDDSENAMDNERNVFVASIDSFSEHAEVNYITSYTSSNASNPFIVPINNNHYMLLWSTLSGIDNRNGKRGSNDKIYFQKLKADGDVDGRIYSAKAHLSDCEPVMFNNKLTWFTTDDNGKTTLYLLDPVTMKVKKKTPKTDKHGAFMAASISAGTIVGGQQIDMSSLFTVSDNISCYYIRDKAEKKAGRINKKGVFTAKGSNSEGKTVTVEAQVKEGSYYTSVSSCSIIVLEKPILSIPKRHTGAIGSVMDGNSYFTTTSTARQLPVKWESSKPSIADVDEETGRITIKGEGKTRITAYFGDTISGNTVKQKKVTASMRTFVSSN